MTKVVTEEFSVNAEEVSDKILTIPNVISVIRLFLVPIYFLLLITGNRFSALIVFIIAASTDFIDGQVARRTNSISKLGKLLDPAIDTILMFTGVLGVVIIGELPAWIAFFVILRELFLLCGGSILLKKYHISVAVIFPGKLATTLLFVGFAGLILGAPNIAGLGIFESSLLPGFGNTPVTFWIWLVYFGVLIQLAVTVYYCIDAWNKLVLVKRGV